MFESETAAVDTTLNMRLRAPTAWLLATAIVLPLPALGGQQELRWWFRNDGNRLTLHSAESDKATDAFGSPRFECSRNSGRIRVEVQMKQRERDVLAELVRRNQEPRVEFVPRAPEGEPLVQISYSELDGWTFGFVVDVTEPALRRFRETGVLQFKLGTAAFKSDPLKGLAAIDAFLRQCSAPR